VTTGAVPFPPAWRHPFAITCIRGTAAAGTGAVAAEASRPAYQVFMVGRACAGKPSPPLPRATVVCQRSRPRHAPGHAGPLPGTMPATRRRFHFPQPAQDC